MNEQPTDSTEVFINGGENAMGKQVNNSSQMRLVHQLAIWSGVLMVLLLMIGFWPLAGFFPPLHPSASAAEIANTYRTEATTIRLGLALSFLGLIFFFPFGSAIAAQTRRIEGQAPMLTYTQLTGLASGSLIFIAAWIFWLAAAFRAERPDSEILLLNDLGWITLVFGFVAYFAWYVALGVAILMDTRQEPIFPRWSGYFSIFVAVSFVPDICVPFFKSGVFSWAGLFPFYLPFTTYLAWILVMVWLTSKAIKRDPSLGNVSNG